MKQTILSVFFGLTLVLCVMACSSEPESEAALPPSNPPVNPPANPPVNPPANSPANPPANPPVVNPKVSLDSCENLACPACQECDAGLCVPIADCQTKCVVAPEIVGMAAPYARGTVNDMVVVGDRHYLATTVGLLIYDVSDPASPQALGWLGMDGPAMALEVVGDRAYLAGGDSGLWIVDVSNPADPSVLANDPVAGSLEGVTLMGETLVLAAGESGLVLIDEASGDILGTLNVEGAVVDVKAHDGLVYAAAGEAGLLIVDPSDPTQPEVVATLATPAPARSVQIVGNRAYVAAGKGGVRVIDISHPSLPIELGGYFGGSPDFKFAEDMDVTPEGIAFVAAGTRGFSIVDLSDPTQVTELANLDPDTSISEVHAVGDVLYLAGHGGVRTYDVSALDAPEELSKLHTAGFATGLAVVDNRAYVADGNGGMKILDVSSKDNPVVLGSIDGFSPKAVDAVGNYAYAVSKRPENCWCSLGQLDIVDVSDPTNPVLVSTFDFSGFPNAVRVVDGIAWIGTTYGGLVLVDVQDPKAPTSMPKGVSPATSIQEVAVSGNYLFVARRYYGLLVFDITDLSNPKEIAAFETPGYAYGLALDGDTVYVADGDGGLQIFDVTKPSSPILIGSVNTPGATHDVAVQNGVAYVSQKREIRFFDVSNPSTPIPLGALGVPGGAFDIVVDGEFTYVTGGHNLLTVIDSGCGE